MADTIACKCGGTNRLCKRTPRIADKIDFPYFDYFKCAKCGVISARRNNKEDPIIKYRAQCAILVTKTSEEITLCSTCGDVTLFCTCAGNHDVQHNVQKSSASSRKEIPR